MHSSRSLFATTIGALVAALLSAILYGIVGVIALRSAPVPSDAIVWLALVAVTLLPVTVFSSLVAWCFFRATSSVSTIGGAVVLLATIVASPVIFILYMSAASPATNWQRGWWLPLVASIIAIATCMAIVRKNTSSG